MTIRGSNSLRDDQQPFAIALADGTSPLSVSAVVQRGRDLLRQLDADERANRADLRSLLTERSAGKFVTCNDLRRGLATRRDGQSE